MTTTVDCSVLPFISQGGQQSEFTFMGMSSRNLYKCKQAVYCVFCLHTFLQSCCCLFIFIRYFVLHFVVACLFHCPLIIFLY